MWHVWIMIEKLKLKVALTRDIKGHKKVFCCCTRIKTINKKMWHVTKTGRWGSSPTCSLNIWYVLWLKVHQQDAAFMSAMPLILSSGYSHTASVVCTSRTSDGWMNSTSNSCSSKGLLIPFAPVCSVRRLLLYMYCVKYFYQPFFHLLVGWAVTK